jgi:hypothetical protein
MSSEMFDPELMAMRNSLPYLALILSMRDL